MAPKRLRRVTEDDEEENESVNSKKLDSLDWDKLGRKCCQYFRRTPTVEFM